MCSWKGSFPTDVGVSGGPLSVLYKCLSAQCRIKVWIRRAAGVRGSCVGFLRAFDKHYNMVRCIFYYCVAYYEVRDTVVTGTTEKGITEDGRSEGRKVLTGILVECICIYIYIIGVVRPIKKQLSSRSKSGCHINSRFKLSLKKALNDIKF